MEGGPTVEDAVLDRVIRVTSIAAMEAYSAPVGYVFSLNAGGRSGVFDVVAGDFSTKLAADTLNGIYVGLADNPTATNKVAKRRVSNATVNSLMFGIPNNSQVDVSADFSTALNFSFLENLTFETPATSIHVIDNVFVENRSDFIFDCKGTLKRIDALPSSVGETKTITFKDCSDFEITRITLDGNHINNNCVVGSTPYTFGGFGQEQRHGLVIDNCKNLKIGSVVGHRASGDTLYIKGADTFNVSIDFLYADSYDNSGDYIALGRNPLSIVQGELFNIGHVSSYGVGHYTMPGGFDIEPNLGQTVKDVFVNSIYCLSSGMNPLGIVTKYGGGADIVNVNIQAAKIISTNASQSITPRLLVITGATDVHIGSLFIKGTPVSYNLHIGLAGTTQPVKNLVIDSYHTVTGFYGILADNLTNASINMRSDDIYSEFSRLYKLSSVDLTITGTFNPDTTDTRFCVHFPSDDPLDNVKISGDLSLQTTGSNAVRCIQFSGSDLVPTNCMLLNLNFDGWWSNSSQTYIIVGAPSAYLEKSNCKGVTDTNDITEYALIRFKVGDHIRNTAPNELGNTGSKYIIAGWVVTESAVLVSDSTFIENRVLTGN
jgi:hypothetical protein